MRGITVPQDHPVNNHAPQEVTARVLAWNHRLYVLPADMEILSILQRQHVLAHAKADMIVPRVQYLLFSLSAQVGFIAQLEETQ